MSIMARLLRVDGHCSCVGQTASAFSYSAGLRWPRLLCSLRMLYQPSIHSKVGERAAVRLGHGRSPDQLPLQSGEERLREGRCPSTARSGRQTSGHRTPLSDQRIHD